ncbi:hypothetical protein [Calothrix sp. PCC 7507]|uniref:hypothetical protein n=1 Tax=Calothrix sp. PCC 7507 TaxID=99598 RepID=UPI00029ED47C|nr:hypothetical protein [Calothrix sp. PCC 7507]AFY32216.1 hypothetical protein Cal7507_1759 [Calothrix sp. PCC 7507]
MAKKDKINAENDSSQLSPEVLDKIKHPPNIDDVIRQQSPAEHRGNPGLVPETYDQPADEMIDLDKE